MFRFQHKTAEEIENLQTAGLLAKGTYSFVVKEAQKTVSQNGNEMLKVHLRIKDEKGQERSIWDWLMTTDNMIFKLRHFCINIGMEDDYNKDCLDPLKMRNRVGEAIIDIQKETAKKDDPTVIYPAKNVIKDYVKTKDARNEPFNDDITF